MIIQAIRYDSRGQSGDVLSMKVTDELQSAWQQLQDRGCRITVELLHNASEGFVSVCIEDPEVDDDLITRIIKNELDHPEKMTQLVEGMIRDFDPGWHEEWRQMLRGESDD